MSVSQIKQIKNLTREPDAANWSRRVNNLLRPREPRVDKDEVVKFDCVDADFS